MNKHLKHLCVVSVISVAAIISPKVFSQVSASIACPDYKRGPTNIPGQKVGKKVGKALEAYTNDLIDEYLSYEDYINGVTMDSTYCCLSLDKSDESDEGDVELIGTYSITELYVVNTENMHVSLGDISGSIDKHIPVII